MGYLVALTKTRTLYVVQPKRSVGVYRITRVHPPREHARTAPPVAELLGDLVSLRPASGPVPADGTAVRAAGKTWVPIEGTQGAPLYQKRMLVGGVESPREVTSPLVFVREMPESRGWVIPHMIRAQRAGDPVAHLLCYEQVWESRPHEPSQSFYQRYRAYQAELSSMVGDPKPVGVAYDEVAAALDDAAGAEMTEIRSEVSSSPVKVRIRLQGRRVRFTCPPLVIREEQREAIAESLTQAWNRVHAAFQGLGTDEMLRFRARAPRKEELPKAA